MKHKVLMSGILIVAITVIGLVATQAQPDFSTAFIPQPQTTDEPSTPVPPDGNPDSDGEGTLSNIPTTRGPVLADIGTTGIVYVDRGHVIVYGVDENSRGFVALTASPAEIGRIPEMPDMNTLIKRSDIVTIEDGGYALYRLSSGELQVNIGPDDEGYVYYVIFSGLDATGAKVGKFNLSG